jgi:hypothetical protein
MVADEFGETGASMGKCYLRCSANAVNSESVPCGGMDLFSAKGAVSCSSLGQPPRIPIAAPVTQR